MPLKNDTEIAYSGIKILIIEDDFAFVHYIKNLIENNKQYDFKIISANTVSKGLRSIEKNEVDVILLDLTLPDSSGIETIFQVKQTAKNIPILVLTGLQDEELARKAINAGVQDYIDKSSVNKDSLIRRIFNSIDRNKLMKTIETLAKTSQMDEKRLNTIIEKNADGIIIVDINGDVQFVNLAAEKLFLRKKSEFIGCHFGFPTNAEKAEIDVIQKGGKMLVADMRVTTIEWENKEAYLISIRDITERKEVELKLKESERDLDKKVKIRTKELETALEQQKLYLDQILKASELKTEFMDSMSHDLRTPLNCIIGFTDLLLEGSYGSVNDDQMQFILDISTSGQYLLDMIKNILDISKIEAGQLNLNYQHISFNKIIHQVKSTIKPLYSKKNLSFRVENLKHEIFIYCDPTKFREILYNLLSNAIKFTNKGEILLNISENENEWVFNVIDTGIGIAEKDYYLIFQGFTRINSPFVQSTPGSGLGLLLTKRLVELHGGEIWFKSELGKGSTFSCTIPKKYNQNE